MSKALTDVSIRNAKPGPARREIPDAGARGLYLLVQPSGRKSFCVRYRYAGLPRKLTLQAGISLSAARKMAADAMHEVAQGRDPAEAKLVVKAKARDAREDTVEAICTSFMKREGANLRTAHVREQTLKRLVYPTLGRQQIDTVKRSQIVRLLDHIEDENGLRQADLVLAYLRRVFNWHAARTDEFRSPVVKGMARYSGKAHERSRTLDDAELRAVWNAADTGGAFGSLVRFLLLTGCRLGEGAGLRWDEIDGAGIWTLPAARNKSKVDLARPLSKAALAIVNDQPRLGDFVFSVSGRRLNSFGRCKRDFTKNCNVQGWRLHDLRRTARSLMSRAGVVGDIGEMCLGHALRGVRGVYDRHRYEAEMRHAFEALAALIDRIVNPPADIVTPLHGRQ